MLGLGASRCLPFFRKMVHAACIKGNPKKFRLPKSNCSYWQQKIVGNRKRDREINKELRRLGWCVLRFWESSLKDEESIIGKLKLLL